jgi:hypothetical protein
LCKTGQLQVLLQLQQTSKQLQAAVAQILQGQRQLPVAFSTVEDQQLRGLQQWLQIHAGLVTGLQLQIDPYSIEDDNFTQHYHSSSSATAATAADEFIGTAAQRAVLSLLAVAADNSIPLQSLTLRGTTASRELLQQLPAAHLTELHAQVDFGCMNSDNMRALAALSRLRRLTLEGHIHQPDERSRCSAWRSDFALLAAALQQLTELHMNPVEPAALQVLPPKLQQLHVAVHCDSEEEVLQLAEFVGCKGSLLRSLKLVCSEEITDGCREDSEAAFTALAAAFTAAAEAPASSSAAATAAAAPAAGTSLQLASLSVQPEDDSTNEYIPVGPLLTALPASSLTHLDCNISWASKADVAALCSLTGLRSLQLQGKCSEYWIQRAGGVDYSVVGQSDSVLAQLSVLQQLTRLQLASVRRVQLQHLQLPRLQHLDVVLVEDDNTAGEALLLGHMTALTALAVDDWCPADQLPSNLAALKLPLRAGCGECPSSSDSSSSSCSSAVTTPRSISLQPVLGLNQLQKLHLDIQCVDSDVAAATAEEIAQLSMLHSLQDVRIAWDSCESGDDAAAVECIAAAFALLRLKALSWVHVGMPAVVMQHLGRMQGLTALELEGFAPLKASSSVIASQDCATPAQLAAALRQLPALRYLKLFNDTWDTIMDIAPGLLGDDSNGVEELLQAIDSLKRLFAIRVDLPVRMKWVALRQLQMKQLVPNLLARDCRVDVSKRCRDKTEFIRMIIECPARRTDRPRSDEFSNQ